MRVPGAIFLAVLLLPACSREGEPTAAARPETKIETAARRPRGERAPIEGREPAPEAASAPTTLDTVATATDTFESLRARHGDAAVIRETLPGAEGDTIDGWILFPNDPARRIEVYPDEAGEHPISLTVRDGSTWVRADGVRPGLDTGALEELNGRPFDFAGFGWDYGGLVMDWNGGKLAHDGRFVGPVRLCEPESRPAEYPTGDGEFKSDLPIVRANPARVCQVGLALEPQSD